MKYKLALCGIMTALLMVGMAKMARSDDKPAVNLSPELILIEAQHTYDSLMSYSDKGKTFTTVSTVSNLNANPSFITFTTKLARPNLYRIEYGRERPGDLSQGIMKTDKGIVWSVGEGDFLEIGHHQEKLKDQHWALLSQDVQSGGATVIIPGAFFKTHWSNLLETFESNWKREANEKVGDIDCYVLSKQYSTQREITLWIGKRDFLIHQIRSVMTGDISGTTTETHSDIVVNQKFLPTDFTP